MTKINFYYKKLNTTITTIYQIFYKANKTHLYF